MYQKTSENHRIEWKGKSDQQNEGEKILPKRLLTPLRYRCCALSIAVCLTIYTLYSLVGRHGSCLFCIPPVPSLWKWTTTGVGRYNDYSQILEVKGSNFKQFADGISLGLSLSSELKCVEMAMTDSAILIASSSLGGKVVIMPFLSNFSANAREASRGLQKLSSRIEGAADTVMVVTSYALKGLENTAGSRPLLAILNSIIPWAPIQTPSIEAIEAAMSTITRQVDRLIPMIDVNDKRLLKMEENLLLLQELISCEHLSIVAAQSDILGGFWMRMGVGGNGKKLRQFDRHLQLLIDLEASGNQAAIRIAAVSKTLRKMKQGMEGIGRRCRHS